MTSTGEGSEHRLDQEPRRRPASACRSAARCCLLLTLSERQLLRDHGHGRRHCRQQQQQQHAEEQAQRQRQRAPPVRRASGSGTRISACRHGLRRLVRLAGMSAHGAGDEGEVAQRWSSRRQAETAGLGQAAAAAAASVGAHPRRAASSQRRRRSAHGHTARKKGWVGGGGAVPFGKRGVAAITGCLLTACTTGAAPPPRTTGAVEAQRQQRPNRRTSAPGRRGCGDALVGPCGRLELDSLSGEQRAAPPRGSSVAAARTRRSDDSAKTKTNGQSKIAAASVWLTRNKSRSKRSHTCSLQIHNHFGMLSPLLFIWFQLTTCCSSFLRRKHFGRFATRTVNESERQMLRQGLLCAGSEN